MKPKVLVAMSGGVDSSVAALLLKKQGYEVAGVTLRLWHHDDDKHRPGGCCSLDQVADARRVCDLLGVPHYVIGMEELFRREVVDAFCAEYLRGRTPNPCITCNQAIKFGALLHKAFAMGFDRLATGHYATIDEHNGYCLKKGVDPVKDQTYFLYRLTRKELAHVLFPVGGYTKKEIRAAAEQEALPIALKPDSQEVCFIDGEYKDFLRAYIGDFAQRVRPGPIVTMAGERIGEHTGIPFYTVGQHKGLGTPLPLYVVRIDQRENRIVVGTKQESYSKKSLAADLSWVQGLPPALPLSVTVKIRSQHRPCAATLHDAGENRIEMVFDEPQFAVTPGQSAVFYQGEYVLGGGIIE